MLAIKKLVDAVKALSAVPGCWCEHPRTRAKYEYPHDKQCIRIQEALSDLISSLYFR